MYVTGRLNTNENDFLCSECAVQVTMCVFWREYLTKEASKYQEVFMFDDFT